MRHSVQSGETFSSRTPQHLPTLLASYNEINKRMLRTKSADLTRIYLRYHYIRYADDWIFITNAKPVLAKYIKNKLASFLHYHLDLTLSPEKTKITNILTEKVKFLGFSIFKLKTSKIIISRAGNPQRTTNANLIIGIDSDRVLERLKWKGFTDYKSFPREQPALSILSDYEIITRYNYKRIH